ncbi:TIGR02996 domain-containing protein [Frigoriglobus tundricola]
MSSDGAALVAAIRATPDDDTPRLGYADRLDNPGSDDSTEGMNTGRVVLH